MKRTSYIIILICMLCTGDLFAQSGMRFPELSKKLEAYFADELIQDIHDELPDNDSYQIWGWDVGDFSGDGYYDLALTVKFLRDKRKIMQVYLFVDNDGFISKVGQFPYEYFELPLEIGVSIKQNACFVTKKRKQFDWVIKGYRFDNGALILLDDFQTYRQNQYTVEKHKNYSTCVSETKYILTSNNNTVFEAKYVTIPSYERGRTVYKGYANSVSTSFPEFVFDGAFYYQGDEDAKYDIRSNFDSENLYFSINIADDEVVSTRCDTCCGDNIELWFDFYPLLTGQDRLLKDVTKGKKINPRSEADTSIYSITFSPGDFLEIPPFVKGVKSTDSVSLEQKLAVNRIKIVTTLNKSGYNLKLKIPFEVFGIDLYPADEMVSTDIGFTLIVNDIDNEFRPEETARIATSQFNQKIPASFGELTLIPTGMWYGEAENVYHDEILKLLNENGF